MSREEGKLAFEFFVGMPFAVALPETRIAMPTSANSPPLPLLSLRLKRESETIGRWYRRHLRL